MGQERDTQKARVLFFGYGRGPVQVLKFLRSMEAEIVGVVLAGNRRGAKQEALQEYVGAQRLPLLIQPTSGQSLLDFTQLCHSLQPDLILVYSYTLRLPAGILSIPPLGAVNLHGGLLPMFRGPHVLNWAIINGERETGVTAHYMEAEWDTGPIIGMSKFAIDFEDDALTVEEKLHRAAVEVLAMHWEAIVTRTANVYAQDEGRARYWPRRRPEDGRIDWQDSAINVHNLVRALVSPWPGAFAFLGQTKVIFQRVFPREDIQLRESPGTVHYDSTGILNIATAEGWIMVREVLVEGAVVTDKQIGNVLNCQDGDRFA